MSSLTKLFTKQNQKPQWKQKQKPEWQALNKSPLDLDKEWPKLKSGK